ncbi:hypothetical protein PoB_007323100 [Plakobranchus ocellatus]|uniref:Uncharacterized protein n=1 Tax=Plakobranchus ocellatus TaxID=259542 RepID=A0AAV4DSB4_9GAST|nr:hypothetical protein PoB_007323100 [Plakobranchus ocellatus]
MGRRWTKKGSCKILVPIIDDKILVHNKVISGFIPSARQGRRWRGSNPRQTSPLQTSGRKFEEKNGKAERKPNDERKATSEMK